MNEQRDPHDEARLRKGGMRGLVLSFGGQAACLGISCGQIIVVSRLLEPELFGVFAMGWVVLALLYNVKDLGLSSAIVQSLREDQDFLDSAFWLSIAGGLALALASVAIGPLLAAFYGDPRVNEVCWKLAPMFAIGGVTSHYQGVMRRRMQFFRLSAINVAAQIVGTGGAILLAVKGRGIDALVFQTLGQEITCLVLQPLACNWRPRSLKISRHAINLIGFGGNLSVFRLLQNLSSTMDHVALGLFTSPALVGLYNRAQTLLSTPRRQMVQPLGQVMPSVLARLQERPDDFASTSLGMIRIASCAWYAFLALIVALPECVLQVAIGEQWTSAAPVMRLLAIGEMSRMPLILINLAEIQLGNTASLRNFSLLAAPLTAGALLAGAYVGGEGRGLICLAAAYAVLQAGLLVLRLVQIGRDTPFNAHALWSALRQPLALGAVLALAFWLGAQPFGGSAPIVRLTFAALGGTGAMALILSVSPSARCELRRTISAIVGASDRRC
jgi:PST family polysaccharide transporter